MKGSDFEVKPSDDQISKFGGSIGVVTRSIFPPRLAKHVIGIGNRILGEKELRVLRCLCRSKMISIDVGANFGAYTYWMSRYTREVWAFDPVPSCSMFLRDAFPHLHIEEVALSNYDGDGLLSIPYRERKLIRTEAKLSSMRSTYDASRSIPVNVRTLDFFSIANVGLMKIDTEGHELSVLEGSVSTITRSRPRLIIECEERHRSRALATILSFLKPFNYSGWVIRGRKLVNFERASDGYELANGVTSNFIFLPEGDNLQYSLEQLADG